MSHVDEGTLHALLDGALPAEAAGRADNAGAAGVARAVGDAGAADGFPSQIMVEEHVAGCPECRARLENARRFRNEAGAIMGAADPGSIEAPPYREIAALAGSAGQGAASAPNVQVSADVPSASPSGTPRRRRRVSYGTMAWAASIMVAVAAGWWANQMTDASSATSVRAQPQESVDAPANSTSVPSGVDVGGSAVDAAHSRTGISPAAEREVAAPQTARSAVVEPTASENTGLTAGREPQSTATENAEFTAARDLEVSTQRTLAAPAPDVSPEPEVAGPPALEDITISPTSFSASRVHFDSAGVAWRMASRQDAVRWLGGEIYTLPEAAVMGYALSGSAERPLVRTRQSLGDGIVLELLQRSVGVDSSARNVPAGPSVRLTPLGAARTKSAAKTAAVAHPVAAVSTRLGSFLITARAALPPDSLRALIERLER